MGSPLKGIASYLSKRDYYLFILKLMTFYLRVYAFILDGEVEINSEKLFKRDGMGIWNTDSINVKALENARVLLMEIPMSM